MFLTLSKRPKPSVPQTLWRHCCRSPSAAQAFQLSLDRAREVLDFLRDDMHLSESQVRRRQSLFHIHTNTYPHTLAASTQRSSLRITLPPCCLITPCPTSTGPHGADALSKHPQHERQGEVQPQAGCCTQPAARAARSGLPTSCPARPPSICPNHHLSISYISKAGFPPIVTAPLPTPPSTSPPTPLQSSLHQTPHPSLFLPPHRASCAPR